MREINVHLVTEKIAEMCKKANMELSKDMAFAIDNAYEKERDPLGKKILGQLKENMDIAGKEEIPICQDTGMAVVFLKVGQDVHFTGGDLGYAINEGVKKGYEEGYLRKSVVSDPLIRENTKDNTPAVIHTEIVSGDKVEIVFVPKGFGSENMSRLYMLKPSDGREGVREVILKTIKEAGPNACPPVVVGVGIGGTFEKAALISKMALLRPVDKRSHKEHIAELEIEIMEEANRTGTGAGGLGGDTTVLGVNIETYPTHIAGLPVAVNLCCHVNRHVREVI